MPASIFQVALRFMSIFVGGINHQKGGFCFRVVLDHVRELKRYAELYFKALGGDSPLALLNLTLTVTMKTSLKFLISL